MIYLYLAAGGAVGSLARYGMSVAAAGWLGRGFPWGTLLVNLIGSLILGLVVRSAGALELAPETRALLTVGFCGAFTTFSTFSLETIVLLEQGFWARAVAYSLGSVALGVAAVAAGFALAAPLVRLAA